MKLTRAEIGALIVTLFFVALAGGYMLAAGGGSADFTIKTEKQADPAELMAGGDEIRLETGEPESAQEAGLCLNINTATAEELTALPGIGQTLAARIVEYREQNGNYERIEELMDVRGIGEAIFGGLSSMITVD